jgi:hypothetical protein
MNPQVHLCGGRGRLNGSKCHLLVYCGGGEGMVTTGAQGVNLTIFEKSVVRKYLVW